MTGVEHNLKELRVAGILDELSCFCFPYECRFVELGTTGYIETLEAFQPQLLFVESAWHGRDNQWYTKVSQSSVELREILYWCNKHNVPTVFWNKEDPVSFDTFLGTASRFDWVYTTDMDCVPLYKRLLKHNRVGVLPFAACTQSFNPLEKYVRKEKCCFAGSWYALQKERCIDFDKIFDLCKEIFGIDVYDRNVYPGNPNRTFPEKYQDAIVGSLPMNKIDIAYKGYEYGITMNTVKYSSTMEARRIFELLACNTISLSNPCSGIKNLFGDLVIVWENEDTFRYKLEKIKNVLYYKEKFILAALRKVMYQHTYEERLKKVCEDVLGWEWKECDKKICVFSVARNAEEALRVVTNWKRQRYNSQLVIFVDCVDGVEQYENVKIIDNKKEVVITQIVDADFYSYFSAKNYYGPNYLVDLVAATKYTSNSVIGKGSYFVKHDGEYKLENKALAYNMINHMKADRCIVRRHIAETFFAQEFNYDKAVIEGVVATAVDIMNFCENEDAAYCEMVDDLMLNTGLDIDEIYQFCDTLGNQENFTIQTQMSGEKFLKGAIWGNNRIRHCALPEEWVGVYTVSQDETQTYVQVTSDFLVEEYNKEGFVRIFLDGKARGKVLFCLHILDDNGNTIRKVWQKMGTYLRCPIPEEAVRFFYSVIMGKEASFILREVVINAFPDKNININKVQEEHQC